MAKNLALAGAIAASFLILPCNVVVAQTVDGSIQSPPPAARDPAPPGAVDNGLTGGPSVTVGRSVPTADGVGTKTVPAKPCTTAARETDGKTTCIGVPAR